jgi:hypothetical protein
MRGLSPSKTGVNALVTRASIAVRKEDGLHRTSGLPEVRSKYMPQVG